MFYTVNAENSVCYLKSDIIKSRHGFSTRIGGVSTNCHTSSLNLAYNRGDDRNIVLENLSIFAKAVGFDEKSIISLPQVHSTAVLRVDESYRGLGYYTESELTADGYATQESRVTLGVKSADCVPILLEAYDENNEIIAVSALHAGWRGTVSGISKEGVKALLSFGASEKRIRAAIGPAIGACCFEIGDDVVEKTKEEQGDDFAKKHIFSKDGRTYADIKQMNKSLLLSCGLLEENIDLCPECSCCMPEKYYSHRRTKGLRGTMLSVISV